MKTQRSWFTVSIFYHFYSSRWSIGTTVDCHI